MPRAYVFRSGYNGSFKKKNPPPFASRKCSEAAEKQAFWRSGVSWGGFFLVQNLTIIDKSAKTLRKINDLAGLAGDDPGTS